MRNYGTETYGNAIAQDYDRLYADGLGDTSDAVRLLADLAEGGRVLELGVGTGRIALPLAANGLHVWGIDASESILDQLKAKDKDDSISPVIGDFADVAVEGSFAVIFVAFNTLFLLHSQSDQVRCFRNVATHLQAGGAFIVEAMVPDDRLYDRGQRLHVHRVERDFVWLEAARYDATTRELRSQQIIVGEDGLRLYPAWLRLATAPELDLMAVLAGLSLENRWAGWKREPFTPRSTSHVSVYRRPRE